MKILFLGDIVGREARKTVLSGLPKLKNKYEADIIIINIENAAGGRGVTPKIAEQFFDSGVDILNCHPTVNPIPISIPVIKINNVFMFLIIIY